MSNVFDKLGRKVLPKVFDKLSDVGLSDLMDVRGETVTAGTGGGRIKSAAPTIYSNVPVVFAPNTKGYKINQGEILQSNQDYILKFPTHSPAGVRYAIDPRVHRLVVKARTAPADEPAKTFRILSIKDLQGNMYEAECVRENI